MNNKMTKIHIYQQLNLKRKIDEQAELKQTGTVCSKQTEQTENILMVARWEAGWVKKVKG